MFPEKGSADTGTKVRGFKAAFLAQIDAEMQLQHPPGLIGIYPALQLYVTKTS